MILLGQTHLLEHKGAILNTSDSTLTFNGKKLELTKNDYKISTYPLGKQRKERYPETDDGKALGNR